MGKENKIQSGGTSWWPLGKLGKHTEKKELIVINHLLGTVLCAGYFV